MSSTVIMLIIISLFMVSISISIVIGLYLGGVFEGIQEDSEVKDEVEETDEEEVEDNEVEEVEDNEVEEVEDNEVEDNEVEEVEDNEVEDDKTGENKEISVKKTDTCVYNSWQGWTSPDKNGRTSRKRTLKSGPSSVCNDLLQTDTCVYNGWQGWTSPDKNDKTSRKRTLKSGPSSVCNDLLQTDTCVYNGWQEPYKVSSKTYRKKSLKSGPSVCDNNKFQSTTCKYDLLSNDWLLGPNDTAYKRTPLISGDKDICTDLSMRKKCEYDEWGGWIPKGSVDDRVIRIERERGRKKGVPSVCNNTRQIDSCSYGYWSGWSSPDASGNTKKTRTKNSGRGFCDKYLRKTDKCMYKKWGELSLLQSGPDVCSPYKGKPKGHVLELDVKKVENLNENELGIWYKRENDIYYTKKTNITFPYGPGKYYFYIDIDYSLKTIIIAKGKNLFYGDLEFKDVKYDGKSILNNGRGDAAKQGRINKRYWALAMYDII